MNKNKLKDHEIEIIILMTRNYTNQQIADAINLSIHTIKAYNTKIFEKLNATTRTEAIINAVKQGYIKLT